MIFDLTDAQADIILEALAIMVMRNHSEERWELFKRFGHQIRENKKLESEMNPPKSLITLVCAVCGFTESYNPGIEEIDTNFKVVGNYIVCKECKKGADQ